jgi:hypothetical protein
MRSPRAALLGLLAPLLVAGAVVAGDPPDPGVVLEEDLGSYTLHARDLASSSLGPTLRVVIGSPSHPTPTGVFQPARLVRHPGWSPGPIARSLGGSARPPSSSGPLGLGKLPLLGAIQIHAGADPVELGKPLTLGCVGVDDASWEALVRWLAERETLHPWRHSRDGEAETGFRRPLRVVVRQSP